MGRYYDQDITSFERHATWKLQASFCLVTVFHFLFPVTLFAMDLDQRDQYIYIDEMADARQRLAFNECLVAFTDDFSCFSKSSWERNIRPNLEEVVGVPDSIEGFNRSVFFVNEGLMLWLFRPLTRGYSSIAPKSFREAVSDASYNVEMPARLASCLCQAKWNDAGIVGARFFINVTVGVGGFYDAAENIWGLRRREEDFGQAFASWGIGPGCYLFLPLHGPTTVRDGVGLIFDYGFDPKTYLPVPGVGAFIQFNEASLKVDEFERIIQSYEDPYWTMKDFWYVARRVKIAN